MKGIKISGALLMIRGTRELAYSIYMEISKYCFNFFGKFKLRNETSIAVVNTSVPCYSTVHVFIIVVYGQHNGPRQLMLIMHEQK